MAQKKITDLQLIDEVSDELNLPSDNTIQSYRCTAEQIWDYILGKVEASDDVYDYVNAKLVIDGYPYLRVSKSNSDSPYTLVRSVSHVDVDTSGGAVTVSVPTASSSYLGQTVWIRKVGVIGTNVTVSGGVSTTLHTDGESIQINCNGSAWVIVRRVIPSVWTSFTPTGITTLGGTYSGMWRRVGDSTDVQYKFLVGTAASVTGGSFYFDVPSFLPVNSSKALLSATRYSTLGYGHYTDTGTQDFDLYPQMVAGDLTKVYAAAKEIAGTYVRSLLISRSANTPVAWATNDEFTLNCKWPVTNWNS